MNRHKRMQARPIATSRRQMLLSLGGGLLLGTDGQTPLRSAAQGATPAANTTRRVRDQAGREVEAPVAPQRIVVLDPNRTIVNVVELGIVPVGATTNPTNPDAGFAPVIADIAAQIENVGLTGNADLERIVALRPDLILFASNYQDLSVDVLQAIAPTISYPFPGSNVAEHLAFVGEVTGREDEARQVAADFAATVAAARESLGLAGVRAAVPVFYNTEGLSTFGLNGPQSVLGTVLVDLGAILVPTQIAGEPLVDYYPDLSLEVMGEVLAEAEVLVAARYHGQSAYDAAFTTTVASPLWQSIPVVAAGQVAVLNVQPAFGNWGVRGLELALTDLAEQLATIDFGRNGTPTAV